MRGVEHEKRKDVLRWFMHCDSRDLNKGINWSKKET